MNSGTETNERFEGYSLTNEEKRILWIHGWGTSSEIWAHSNTLPEWSHEYYSYAGCSTAEDFLDRLQDQIDTLQPRAIIGWSMGGMLLLDWLSAKLLQWNEENKAPAVVGEQAAKREAGEKRQPRRLPRIVIVSSTLRFIHTDRSSGWPRRVVERMLAKLSTDAPAVLKQFRQAMTSMGEIEQGASTDLGQQGLETGLMYLMQYDRRRDWNELIAPAVTAGEVQLLWIHGRQDEICPIGALPEKVDGLQIRELSSSGHLPFLTESQIFYESLRDMLNERSD